MSLEIEEREVETKALSIVDKAKLIKVTDAPSYLFAGDLWKVIDATIKEVKATFDPIVEAAHKAHKEATTKRASFLDPLENAKKGVKSLMSAYDAEQDRIRLAEQKRLEEEQRKREEEERLALAVELEQSGEKEQAEAVLETPVPVVPVILQKATPKLEGGPVYRTVWKFRIVDLNLIPRQYLIPDEVKIGGVVRALKGDCNIPGVEVYQERV
jgi:vacuolar-type H+-ATPase subunit I/STV1